MTNGFEFNHERNSQIFIFSVKYHKKKRLSERCRKESKNEIHNPSNMKERKKLVDADEFDMQMNVSSHLTVPIFTTAN